METIKNALSGNSNKSTAPQQTTTTQSSGGGWGDKVNSALGGGKSSEAKEDYLDKGIDAVQEHVLGQGPQNNEGAFEQRKDEYISDAIRGQYKSATGKEFPVADK